MQLRRVAPVVGLLALLAADAGLIGSALRPSPADVYVPAAAAATSTARPTPSVKATEKFTPPTPVPVEKYVTAVSPTIAWVALAGSCVNPDVVWVTGDQGATWTRNALPGRVLRLLPDSSKEAQAVGANAGTKCSLKQWATTDSGAEWGKPGDASPAWTRDPNDSQAVHTARNDVVRPCGPRNVIDLTVLDGSRAQVLCANGDVRATTDGGRNWRKSYTAKNALALTVAEGGSGVIVKPASSCRGVVAVPIVSGRPAKEGECVVAPTVDGQISVSNAGNAWWLLVGSELFTAEEPGGPWTRTKQDPGPEG